MKKKLETLEVVRQLGVAPSTGSVIAALLNNQLHPDHYRGLKPWPLEDMNAPAPATKVMCAICELLELEPTESLQTLWKDDYPLVMYIDHGIEGQPTVIYDLGARLYSIYPIDEVINMSRE